MKRGGSTDASLPPRNVVRSYLVISIAEKTYSDVQMKRPATAEGNGVARTREGSISAENRPLPGSKEIDASWNPSQLLQSGYHALNRASLALKSAKFHGPSNCFCISERCRRSSSVLIVSKTSPENITIRSASIPIERIDVSKARAAAQYHSVWVMLPTIRGGQRGCRSVPTMIGTAGLPIRASARLAHDLPQANSFRLLREACLTSSTSAAQSRPYMGPLCSSRTTSADKIDDRAINRLKLE